MTAQSLIVAAMVVCCFVYAAWTLLPQAVRRLLANGLLRLPLPGRLTASLQRAARTPAGCHCSGCDLAAAKPPPPAQPVLFHPRQRTPVRTP